MSAVQFSHSALARRLSALARLYEHGQASDLMARTLDKLLAYEADQCRQQLAQARRDLSEFEQRYQSTSADFFRRYQSGQTDDRMDFVEWASLFQMAQNLEQRLALLEGEAAA